MDAQIRPGVVCSNCGHEHCLTCKMCHKCGCIHYSKGKDEKKKGGFLNILRKR